MTKIKLFLILFILFLLE